jgi:integrase
VRQSPNKSIVRFERLSEKESQIVHELMAAARSEQTRRGYASDVKRFLTWCNDQMLEPFPVQVETVMRHVVWLIERNCKLATIERTLVALGVVQAAIGGAPFKASVELRQFLKGLRRRKRADEVVREAPALMLEDLRAVVGRIDVATRQGLRDRALLLVGWFGAMRRSELVALNFGDIVESREGLRVTIRRSKTDQESRGAVLGLPRRRDELCPVAALRAWRAALATETSATQDGEAVFVALDNRCRLRRLAPQAVERILRRYVGQDSPPWTPHSLRAGFATSAARAGKSTWAIRRQTRHRSVASLTRYMRDAEVFVNSAADL